MIRYINCTPHDICVEKTNGEIVIFPKGKYVARVTTVQKKLVDVGDIPLYQNVKTGVTGIPELENGEVAIVSAMVLEALAVAQHPYSERAVAPDTGTSANRDGNGQITSVKGWIVN